MSSIAMNTSKFDEKYTYLKGFPKEYLINFQDKNEKDLVYAAGILMEVIGCYKSMDLEERRETEKIICEYFKECGKRKMHNLSINDNSSCLTTVYKNLWDFCTKHDLKPRSTSDGVYYFEPTNLDLSAEEKDAYENLINWEHFRRDIYFTDLSEINKLLEVFKKKIEHPYTKCDSLLEDLQKLGELSKMYSEEFGEKKKYSDVIENFFSGFCIENGLSHCSGYSLIPKTECKPFFITSSVKKNLDMIRAIAILKIVSEEDKCKLIKEQLEKCSIEFKKSKYLSKTHPESFHAIRAMVNSKEIEKFIEEIKSFYSIKIVDGNVEVCLLLN